MVWRIKFQYSRATNRQVHGSHLGVPDSLGLAYREQYTITLGQLVGWTFAPIDRYISDEEVLDGRVFMGLATKLAEEFALRW
jgi:hypothetical protein